MTSDDAPVMLDIVMTNKNIQTTLVYINGAKVDYRSAVVSVFDYTLHCGIGLFESVLAIDDRLIKVDEHLDRMEGAIARLGLTDLNYDRRRIMNTLRRAAREHPGRVRKIKVLLTEGYSPLWPGTHPKPKTIIIVVNHRLEFKKQKLFVSPMIITSDNPLRGNKTLNFLTEWLSQDKAHKAGCDQGIIINQHGHVAETGSANLFIARDGILYTPLLESGGLPGTIRREVIRLAKVNDISCVECPWTETDLFAADEIFTTSSFKLVWPVVELKSKKIKRFAPGRFARAMFDRLKSNYMTGCFEDILKLKST